MSESPYINWYTSDFLQGVADLECEQIGVYAIVLNLIADRGSPIDDDPRWLARRCGSSTRIVKRILDDLEQLGKIERRNGLIGNKRMLTEVQKRGNKSAKARAAATIKWKQWRDENKPQLDLDEPEQPKKQTKKSQSLGKKSAQTSENNDVLKSPVKNENSNEIKETDDANAADSRARAVLELELDQSNEQNLLKGSARESIDRSIDDDKNDPQAGVSANGPLPAPTGAQVQPVSPRTGGAKPDGDAPPTLRDKDLAQLVDLCTNAAGFYPRSPGAIAREFDLVKTWRDLGMDFEAVVIPTIKRGIEDSVDPTSSLLRFDRKVRFAHAQQGSKAAHGPAPPPPPIKLDFASENASLRSFRADLAEAIGHRAYASTMNKVNLEIASTGNGSKPLRIIRSKSDPFRLLDGDRTAKARTVARKHGFTDIWE